MLLLVLVAVVEAEVSDINGIAEAEVSSFFFLTPALAVLFAWALLGDPLTMGMVLGGLVVGIGVLVVYQTNERAPATPPLGGFPVNDTLLEWIRMALRWAHVIIAIGWIGHQMMLYALEKHFRPPRDGGGELGFDKEAIEINARRCYLCNYKFEIDQDKCIHCDWCIKASPRSCIHGLTRLFTDEDGAPTFLYELGPASAPVRVEERPVPLVRDDGFGLRRLFVFEGPPGTVVRIGSGDDAGDLTLDEAGRGELDWEVHWP